jgi:hypothetical protein
MLESAGDPGATRVSPEAESRVPSAAAGDAAPKPVATKEPSLWELKEKLSTLEKDLSKQSYPLLLERFKRGDQEAVSHALL